MTSRPDESKLAPIGLHFCRRYLNLVRYDPQFCGECPFNGIRRVRETPEDPETRF